MTNNFWKCSHMIMLAATYFVTYILLLSVGGIIAVRMTALQPYIGMIAMAGAGGLLALLLPVRKLPLQLPEKPALTIPAVFFLAAGVCVILNVVMAFIPWNGIGETHVVQDNASMFGIPFAMRLLSYVVIAPLAEELLFRGTVLHKIGEFAPKWIAILISSIAFGIYHGNLQQGIYAFLCGCVIAWVFVVTGSFWMAVLFHAAANLLVNLAYEFEVIRNIVYSIPVIVILSLLALGSALLIVFSHKKGIQNEK